MKINILKDKINVNPDETILVTRKEFFKYFFRMFLLRGHQTLSDNEIELLSSLCSDTETTISKNNLPPVIKKLNAKQLMDGKELSKTGLQFKRLLQNGAEIILNFEINEG